MNSKPHQSPACQKPDDLASVGAKTRHFIVGHKIQCPQVCQLFYGRRSARVIEAICQLAIASLHQTINGQVAFVAGFGVSLRQPYNVGEDALAKTLKGNWAELTKELPVWLADRAHQYMAFRRPSPTITGAGSVPLSVEIM
jgi:hypothetical protein